MIVQTINLTKRYGKLTALNNLHLKIEEGECFGYIGPNGAGKTTTIKILGTLLQPTWGEARVCGHVIGYESRKIRPLIGYVPDFFGAYEDMAVQEYLEFFASAYNITGKQRTRVVGGRARADGLDLQTRCPGRLAIARDAAAAQRGPRSAPRSESAAA